MTLHPYFYPDYLGPRRWEQWKIALNAAHRLGLAVWQQDDSTYPSGFAAGQVVAANPEFGRTMLVEAAHEVLTGPRVDFTFDVRTLLNTGESLVAVTAYPHNGEPRDLTPRMAEGA